MTDEIENMVKQQFNGLKVKRGRGSVYGECSKCATTIEQKHIYSNSQQFSCIKYP